jgi:lipopolysaccharide transport system ATP-binding protein
MSSVITIQNLSKKYIINHQKQERYTALRDVLANGAKRFTRNLLHQTVPENDPAHEEFWALKDVSFDIQQGDRVGIIGRNGAGKSTLLKVLSRITEPTSGKVKIKGRVASLLEVGTGFHPELTGRENIYLNGAILGMSKAEIKKKFDEIVAFAEVEKFLDTPVKRYSSGMYVRLAFAVAAHLEPEILIVDEVLAVGDAQFQKKCIGRMDEVSQQGKTVLFVSHNFPAVQRLCNKGILLESGKVKNQGEISKILSQYMQTISLNEEIAAVELKPRETKFVSWRMRNASPDMVHSCYSRDVCTIEFRLVTRRIVSNAVVGFAIWNTEGVLMFATSSLDSSGKYLDLIEGTYNLAFKIRLPIKADVYQLEVSLNEGSAGQLDRWIADPKLIVLPKLVTSLPERWHGLINEEAEFEMSREGNEK